MVEQANITLNLKSNVSYPYTINILGNPYNLLDTSNAKTEYRWDITSLTFTNENSLTLQYKINSASVFSTYTSNLNSANIQAVVNALNNLGIGYFNSYIELGQTFIGTYNDNYTFGQLNIYSTLPSLNYNVNLTTAGTLLVIRDYANVLLNPLILNSPVTQIGAYPVYVGETIEYRIGTGIKSITSLVTQTNNITGAVTTLSSSVTPPLSPFAYLISIANGFSYNITTTD